MHMKIGKVLITEIQLSKCLFRVIKNKKYHQNYEQLMYCRDFRYIILTNIINSEFVCYALTRTLPTIMKFCTHITYLLKVPIEKYLHRTHFLYKRLLRVKRLPIINWLSYDQTELTVPFSTSIITSMITMHALPCSTFTNHVSYSLNTRTVLLPTPTSCRP